MSLQCFSTRCQLGCDSVGCINVACSMRPKKDLDIVQVSRSESEDIRGPPEGTRVWGLHMLFFLRRAKLVRDFAACVCSKKLA